MALSTEQIDLSKVNDYNYKAVKEFAQARIDLVEELASHVGGMTDQLEADNEIEDFDALEEIVNQLCGNVNSYIASNEKSLAGFQKSYEHCVNAYNKTKETVKNSDETIKTQTQEKKNYEQVYKGKLGEIDSIIDRISA